MRYIRFVPPVELETGENAWTNDFNFEKPQEQGRSDDGATCNCQNCLIRRQLEAIFSGKI